jgi:hypothetical protein
LKDDFEIIDNPRAEDLTNQILQNEHLKIAEDKEDEIVLVNRQKNNLSGKFLFFKPLMCMIMI